MKTLKIIMALTAIFAIIMMAKCKKETVQPGYGDISVLLDEKSSPDDTPSGVDQVVSLVLHVKSIDIHYSQLLADRWEPLKTQEGLYDLVKLKGDTTATLAAGTMVEGDLSAIRLVLGDKNSVIVNGDRERPLIIPAYLRNGIVFKLNARIIADNHLLTVIYMDPGKSLVRDGENYVFVPKGEAKVITK